MKKKFSNYLVASLLIALLLLFMGYIVYYLFSHRVITSQSIENVHLTEDQVNGEIAPLQDSDEPLVIEVEQDMSESEPAEIVETENAEVETYEQVTEVEDFVEDEAEISQGEEIEQIPEVEEASTEPETITEPLIVEAEAVPVSDVAETENVEGEIVEDVPLSEEAPALPVRVPDAPFMFEPLVIDSSESELIELEFTGYSSPVYDDDYFKDFYVQGEDNAIDYEDGFYYLTLIVNDETMGTIEVKFENGNRALKKEYLLDLVSEYITDEAKARIFADAPEYVDSAYLESRGVECEVNDYEFIIKINFSINDMPMKIISVSGNYRGYSQNNYALTGAVELDKAFFSWVTNYNLFINLNTYLKSNLNLLSASLSTANYLGFGPLKLNFYYSLSSFNKFINFNFSSYTFFHDFVDQNIRLSFGNISNSILSNERVPLGIQFEKNYSYGNGSAKPNQHNETISVYEDSELTITNGNGLELLRKRLSPGTYRLKDFMLSNGVNEITIKLTPVAGMGLNPDGSDQGVQEWTLSYAYDGQLLAKGDTLYGGSISIGRQEVSVKNGVLSGAPKLRVSPLYYYEYYFNDLAINYWQTVGLTDTLTLGLQAAVTTSPNRVDKDKLNLNSVFAMSALNANFLGTTSVKMISGLNNMYENNTPSIYLSLSHWLRFDNPYITSLSLQFGYQNPSYLKSVDNHRFESTISFGGSLGILRYSLTNSLNFERKYGFTSPQWIANGSVSVSPFKNFSISGSMSVNKGAGNENYKISGSISASISLGSNSSASASTNLVDSMNANFYTRFGKSKQHYLQASASNILFKDPSKVNLGVGYSYSGNLFGLNFRTQAYNDFNAFSNSLSLSMSSAFADGAFTIAKNVSSNFILITTHGALKGSQVSVARSTENNSKVLKTRFGTAIYDSLSSYRKNNIVLYATENNDFGALHTFSYELTPNTRDAYVARLYALNTYTASGIILDKDGLPVDLFSSPVYRLITNDDGEEQFVRDDELYLFTDQDGRFILSGLNSGLYFFDITPNGQDWISVHFEITDQADPKQCVFDLKTIDMRDIDSSVTELKYDDEGNLLYSDDIEYSKYLSGYSGTVRLQVQNIYGNEEFWNMLFPGFDEEEDFFFEELASDI